MKSLEIKNVSYAYGKGTQFEKKALSSVSFEIKSGEIVGIIGHTGSGKSTLVRLFNGLIAPDSGEILLDGENINSKGVDKRQLCRRVGLVMQYPEYQLFDETVEKDISFGPKNMGLSSDEIKKRVDKAAEFAGISPELYENSPFDLSGGQKRRVAIAGILAMEPEVLVLDEPAAGLDPKGREDILGGLLSYRDKTGAAVVIVSHNMEDMAKYCDRLFVMKDGELALSGTPKEVFSHGAELGDMGLDIPAAAKIALELSSYGVELGTTPLTVADLADKVYQLYCEKSRA